jgi:hypothetical protein
MQLNGDMSKQLWMGDSHHKRLNLCRTNQLEGQHALGAVPMPGQASPSEGM